MAAVLRFPSPRQPCADTLPVETRTRIRTMSAGKDAALLQVNLLRETWCRLEAGPRGSGRSGSQRRHFGAHLQTSLVLLDALTGREKRRWAAGRPAPPPGRLPERRHFDESRKVSRNKNAQLLTTRCCLHSVFFLCVSIQMSRTWCRSPSSSNRHTLTHTATAQTHTAGIHDSCNFHVLLPLSPQEMKLI